MKKLIGILLLVVAIAMSLPMQAMALDVDTQVEVIGGGGTNNAPFIKCKWETSGPLANNDDNPLKPGLQANPIVPQGEKTVYFWAVVTDDDSMDQITGVWAEIFKPDGTLKHQIELTQIFCTEPDWPKASAAVQAAADAELLTIAPGMTLDEVKTELIKGEAKLYKGSMTFVHGQWGGFHRVEVYALDAQSTSVRLVNCFEYVRTVCVEKDFTTVNFGSLQLSQSKVVSGDEDMGTPEKPTLKNGGNVDTMISVHYTPMYLVDEEGTMILDDNGEPIPLEVVVFNARLGLLPTVNDILPCQPVEIGVLPVCHTWELDLSIHPKKISEGNFGMYQGVVQVTGEDAGTPTAGTPCPPLP